MTVLLNCVLISGRQYRKPAVNMYKQFRDKLTLSITNLYVYIYASIDVTMSAIGCTSEKDDYISF